jgi:uncharacterized protein YkwD
MTLAAACLTFPFGLPAPAATAAVAPRGARACAGGSIAPSSSDALSVERATLCLINQIRAAHHLAPLRGNPMLGTVATSQVAAMVALDYFADRRPSGLTPLTLVTHTAYPNRAQVSVGQTIAWGTGIDARASEIVTAWMQSPPHRRIILTSEYRDAGVAVIPAVPAVVKAGGAGATYAMEFGVRHP